MALVVLGAFVLLVAAVGGAVFLLRFLFYTVPSYIWNAAFWPQDWNPIVLITIKSVPVLIYVAFVVFIALVLILMFKGEKKETEDKKDDKSKAKKGDDAKSKQEVLIRQIPVSSFLVPVEQFWNGLVYWNFFGRGRGKIVRSIKSDYKLLGRWDIGYALKIPGLMDAEVRSVQTITKEIKGDGIPNRGIHSFTSDEEDFLAKELKQLGRELPFPKLGDRPTVGLIAAKTNFTFQLTYYVDDLRANKSLSPEFQADPSVYCESLVTGLMSQFVPDIFADDTTLLEGAYVVLGTEYEAAGYTTEAKYETCETDYTSAEGKKHWADVKKLKFKCTGKSRWRFDLNAAEINELRGNSGDPLYPGAPNCVFLAMLDYGLRIANFKRQSTTFPKNIQDLYDQRQEVELKRQLNRTALQQSLDNERAEIVKRLFQAWASVDNLIQRMVTLKKGLEEKMAAGSAPLPWAEVFEYTAADELLRVMRLAPEGKYALVGGLRDFLKNVAGYTALNGITGGGLSVGPNGPAGAGPTAS